MSYYSNLILVGRVGKAPEMRKSASGKPICTMRVAVNRTEGAERKEVTDWFSVVCFDGQAEIAEKHLGKGDLVLVEGRIQMREFEDREGQKRQAIEVIAGRLRLFPKGRSPEAAAPVPETPKVHGANGGGWAFDAAAVPF